MRSLIILVGVLVFAVGCKKEPVAPTYSTALLSGIITVDGSDDFSGIDVRIVVPGDTLFRAVSNIDGYVNGLVRFRQAGRYVMSISRNNRILHEHELILAADDTLSFSGMIPRLAESFVVTSPEQTAWQTYMRLNRQYDRILRFSSTGEISVDSIRSTIKMWSDLYWSLNDAHPSTFASDQARFRSITMLNGIDDDMLMDRMSTLGNSNEEFALRLSLGSEIALRTRGIEPALAYVDSLKKTTRNTDLKSSSDMRRIELMVLSGDADRSLAEVKSFRRKHKDTAFDNWASALEYELEFLIPGKFLPSFSIEGEGDSITTASLAGKPYMIEFIGLATDPYRDQYSDLVALHAKAADAGIRFISVPLDTHPAILAGFFTERPKRWTVTPIGAFASSNIGDQLRVDQVPMRYLIGADGIVIGRYFSYDLVELETDLTPLLTQPNL